jgi:PAS domain S-box-containing protein
MTDPVPLVTALLGDPILVASILLRLFGVGYSIVLLYRVRDGRFAFLTLMLSLMALRQILTLRTLSPNVGPQLDELPGLVVSVLAVLTVYYLSQYVAHEEEVKETIREKNETLRGFRKAIEHAGHGIFITDREGTIEYANPAVEPLTGYDRDEVIGENPRLWKSDAHDDAFYAEMWETILAGEVWDGEIVNERKDGSEVWVDMTIAPIADDEDEIERFVAVDTDVTERKARERRIQRQNDRLEVLNHTNEILRDVNRELVEAGSRDEVEQAVCEEFAESDRYAFAWISEHTAVSETFRPRTFAGIDEEDVRAFVDAINDGDGSTPFDVAGDEADLQLISDLDERTTAGERKDRTVDETDWTTVAREQGCRSVAVIPLRYNETRYGVLAICSAEPGAFEAIDPAALAELGETVGYAINAVESKRALLTDSVTEIEFTVADPECFAVDLSERVNGVLDLEWMTTESPAETAMYFTVEGADPGAVAEAAAAHPAIAEATVVTEYEEGCLCRFDVEDPDVATTLADHGGVLESFHVEAGVGRVRATLSRTTNVRAVLDALRNRYPDTELLAQRECERHRTSREDLATTLDDELTDRQMEALRTAYVGGFFEWPRRSSGEDIAEVMGISQSTFLQHLRAAKKKLLSNLFEGEGAVPCQRPEQAGRG